MTDRASGNKLLGRTPFSPNQTVAEIAEQPETGCAADSRSRNSILHKLSQAGRRVRQGLPQEI
jgi:hypothetical protein